MSSRPSLSTGSIPNRKSLRARSTSAGCLSISVASVPYSIQGYRWGAFFKASAIPSMASLEAGGFFFITARAMERRASARGFLPGEMSSVRVGQSGRCRHRLPGVISGHANHLRYAEIVGVRWVGFLEGLSNGVCGAEGAQDLIGRAKGAKRLGVRIGHCLTIDR